MAEVTGPIHRNDDQEQRTTYRVTIEDATGEEHTHEWDGPTGGPLEHQGDRDPPQSAIDPIAFDELGGEIITRENIDDLDRDDQEGVDELEDVPTTTWMDREIPETIGDWELDKTDDKKALWEWERKRMDGGTFIIVVNESAEKPGTWQATAGNMDLLERKELTPDRVELDQALDAAIDAMQGTEERNPERVEEL